jgi:hypothetical protein
MTKGGNMYLTKQALILVLLLVTLWAQEAQEEKKEPVFGWSKRMVGTLNLTQANFDNWVQGGENSLAWQLNANGIYDYEQVTYKWSNAAKITYGENKIGSQDARKSIDEIRLESVYSYKLGIFINPYVSLTGETQMMPGYNYSDTARVRISNFLDPGYFMQGIGVGIEPVKEFKTRAGFALKETVADVFVSYTDDPGTGKIEKIRIEPGIESVSDLATKLSENIIFTSKLELFSNVKRFDQIDVRWDNIFLAKVSTYIDVNFNIKLFYDKDISKKRQLKQALSLGLTYSFL